VSVLRAPDVESRNAAIVGHLDRMEHQPAFDAAVIGERIDGANVGVWRTTAFAVLRVLVDAAGALARLFLDSVNWYASRARQ
jgi:hypothetical protein